MLMESSNVYNNDEKGTYEVCFVICDPDVLYLLLALGRRSLEAPWIVCNKNASPVRINI